ncbi:MAG TPA: energy transducer TonB [Desulfomonilaceae bacterium]|nr:energy transducer TonB [Desulfomonilaceae bacterium]
MHHVTDFLHKQVLDGADETLFDDYDLSDAFSGLELRSHISDTIRIENKNRVLFLCIVISLLLHFGLAFAIPRFLGLGQPESFLKPGEKVTKVKLVDQEFPDQKPEPPPVEASALSDRNHSTDRERLPKLPSQARPPLGSMEPMEKRMASLAPPPAPEDAVKQKDDLQEEPKEEEIQKKDEHPRLSTQQSHPKNSVNRSKEAVEPRRSKKQPHRRVDLRPTPDEVRTGISGPPGGSTDFHPDGDLEEAVVDINTREDRFASYLLHLKRKIQGVWVYPSAAAKSGIGGSLTVEFSIAKTGELLYVNLLDSSGHTILDESAMKAVQSAAPYFPFPERMRAKRLRVRANFMYITQNFFKNIM